MKIGIHQPNLVPHFGFFYKMSQCDIFIILSQAQFEKNGYQNRACIQNADKWGMKSKWITNPVMSGLDPIYSKYYTDGSSLLETNMDFIIWMARLLGIQAQIVMDIPTNSRSTQRLLDNINFYGGSVYVTRSDKDKPEDQRYLDEELLRSSGVGIEYCSTPNEKLNILEMLMIYGIEGTKNQLYKAPKQVSA